MPKYRVTVSCMVYASDELAVEAPDEDAAADTALEMVQAGQMTWEVDCSQRDDVTIETIDEDDEGEEVE